MRRLVRLRQRNQTQIDSVERGSSLALLPVLIVICVLLGVLAVNTANVFMARRALVNAASAAANDAASGISNDTYFENSNYVLTNARVYNIVRRSLDNHGDQRVRILEAVAINGRSVRVRISDVAHPFFRTLLSGSFGDINLVVAMTSSARSDGSAPP
jgi:hypothetical protein